GTQQPASDRGRTGDGERLAQVPIGVGARPFGSGKPVGKQNQRGRKDSAFGDAEQKPHDFKLAESCDQTATDSANPPKDQQNGDHFPGAPATGQVTPGNLQQDVAEE